MYDVLVIGSGIAGLTFAIKIAERFPKQRVLVLTKTEDNHSNTSYAQGGIAAVWNNATDNFEKHIADTHDAGDGLCNPEAVEIVVKEGPARVRELIEWGTRFDQDKTQTLYDLCKEGGHSENRILHYKDFTGKEIQRALLERVKQLKNVDIYEHYFAVDIITQHHKGHNITRLTPNIECYGAYVLNKETNKVEKILAKVTMIATGGTGQIYRNTTNPGMV
jgi:L-aspartate oxidase